MTVATIRLILEPDKEAAVKKVLAPVKKSVGLKLISTEPYAKGGTDAILTLQLPDAPWSEQMMELIRTAQYLGFGWYISGNIDEEISLTCEKLRFTGIRWANIEASKY